MSIEVTMGSLPKFNVEMNEGEQIPVEMNGVGPVGAPMYFGTTEEWAARTDLVSKKNNIYVWTDYKQVGDQYVAGVKIGDGLAYVVDLPFLDAQFQAHAADSDVHVTPQEKAFWNAKNRSFVEGENLILTDL